MLVSKWSKYKMEIWQNLEQKRNTDHDFPPTFMWAENKKDK